MRIIAVNNKVCARERALTGEQDVSYATHDICTTLHCPLLIPRYSQSKLRITLLRRYSFLSRVSIASHSSKKTEVWSSSVIIYFFRFGIITCNRCRCNCIHVKGRRFLIHHFLLVIFIRAIGVLIIWSCATLSWKVSPSSSDSGSSCSPSPRLSRCC